STVQELADDLQRFLEDKPIHARRPTLLDRGLKWSRRHKGAVASAVTLLLLGMVGLMISNVLIARSNSEVTAAYQRESEKAEEVRRQWTRAENNLTQALQVVDFLTRISAEELGDRPELLQVRQRMLAGALQYYQRFIEQHQGDEAARAELDASRKRVTQILSALSAQQEYVHLMLRAMLLEEPDVRHDLGIGWDPDGKFKKLFERVQDQRHEVFRLSLTLSEQERGKKFKEMAEANEQAMAAILTSDQARRLKQIALQMRSPQVFAEPALADALRITADQKTRIRVLLDEAQRTQRDVFRPGMHPPEIHHEIHKIGKKTEQAVLALLTTPQKTAWREMTGETFYGRLHFALEAGFGPPGLGPRPEPPPEPGWGREDGFPPKGKKPPPKGPKKF
ncbi:MAG TPA: hypothetical protein VEL76_28250, partial [Gemmataceae bacterium]|nr:hypothetical protein [Gemmataceae bacterium]